MVPKKLQPEGETASIMPGDPGPGGIKPLPTQIRAEGFFFAAPFVQ